VPPTLLDDVKYVGVASHKRRNRVKFVARCSDYSFVIFPKLQYIHTYTCIYLYISSHKYIHTYTCIYVYISSHIYIYVAHCSDDTCVYIIV